MKKFESFLLSLNTHFIAKVGWHSAWVSAALIIVCRIVKANYNLQQSDWHYIVADSLSDIFLGTGVLGARFAYWGKPESIKGSDAQAVTQAALVGAPHPVTLAKGDGMPINLTPKD